MIKVEHLTKYYGDFLAVDDLSFEIDEGHVYGFLGPNGAGKSTTMNIMTGCLSATSGHVSIGGFDIFEDPDNAKRLIGYLPEQPPLYMNETPVEYLRFVGEAKGLRGQELNDQIESVIRQVRIEEVKNRRISALSKGYKQRVGIAQALLGNPKVIILDEPTVGLDPLQIIEIRDLIRQLGQEHTVILSSHILSEVQAICEKILIIAHGRLVAFDEPDQLERSLLGTNEISFTAYVFGAFLLAIVGFGSMLYNLQAAVSNFEYVLSFGSIVFVVIVPILTMRVIAEERRQKTDQLLYSLPISTTQVVLGKYLALLVVYLIPLGIISLYPLIFAQFGDVYLPTSYGSLLAIFIMGAALIAIGIFISSLTENQGLAAGVCIAVILFNYYSVSLSEYVSSTAFGSVLALAAIILALGAIVRHLTKSELLASGVCVVLFALVVLVYFTDYTKFEGLLPNIMKQLSLFDRFSTFVSGVFDLTAIVYYLSVAAFFLFLTVQSLEKRRYN